MTGDPERESLLAMTHYLVSQWSTGTTLERVCVAALDAVDSAAFAGMTMTVDARKGTYAFTNPAVSDMDRRQYETGDGPCLEALHTGRVIIIRSTTEPGPYPDFRVAASAHGIRSVMSLPLQAGDELVGALSLYSERENAFDNDQVARGATFAGHAAYRLTNTKAYWDARMLHENLHQAMESRAEIEQAKGIIIQATGCSADEAFDALRRQSQHENIKLREIAAETVRRAQRRQVKPHQANG